MSDRDWVYNRTDKGRARRTRYRERNREAIRLSDRLGVRIVTAKKIIEMQETLAKRILSE